MSVGFPANKLDVDSRAGQLALQLRDTLRQVSLFKAWLDSQTDAALTALGYNSTDIAQLRSSYVDLDKLRTIYEGTATQATTYDFRTFAKLLTGVV
jgi:hypothetical protein